MLFRSRTTTGEAIVEHVRTYTVGNGGNKTTIHELTLQYGSVGGTFTYGQELHNIDSDKQVYTEIQAVIQSIQVVNGGSGYAPGDVVIVESPPNEGYGAYGEVVKTSNGIISGVVVNNGGQGFSVGEPIILLSGSGSGAVANVATINNTSSTIALDLTVEPFDAATSMALNAANYGAAGQASWNLDTPISTVFAGADFKNYYTPWIWTNVQQDSAALANIAILVSNQSNEPFWSQNVAVAAGYTGRLFVLADALDVTTTKTSASIKIGRAHV